MGLKYRRFKGYADLLGPEQLQFTPGHPGRRVDSPAAYLGWHTRVITTRNGDPWDSPTGTIARVNRGRWIADCVWCETGMLTRPDWGVAYCAECGARYHREQVSFPKELKRIRAALVVRVKRNQQNWDRRQTADELEAENELPEVITTRDIPAPPEEERPDTRPAEPTRRRPEDLTP